jgi:hypothetical protein
MRYLIFFIFISIRLCNAQGDHVLRIVSYRGDVSIDNISIHSGQLVLSSSQKLAVAKNSYVYVLTPKGYSMKLGPGSYTIDGIEDLIYRLKHRALVLRSGTVSKPMPYGLRFIGIDEGEINLKLVGDSVYLRWKNRNRDAPVKLPYRFKVFSIFEDVLFEVETNKAEIKIDLRDVAKGDIVVMARINEGTSPPLSVKFITAEESAIILDDLSRVTLDTVSKSILDLVIHDTNELFLDLMFKLDKMATLDTTSLPNDLKNYVSILKTKYEM